MHNVNYRIKELRVKADLKQWELAEKLGIQQNMVSNYENGREPPYAVLEEYARYFDVSADYLMGLTDQKKPVQSDIAKYISTVGKIAEKKGAEHIVTSQDILRLFELLRAHYRAGTPSGNLPMDTLHRFVVSFSATLEASNAGDGIALLQAINDTVSSTFDLTGMLTGFVEKDTGTSGETRQK